ncbi:tetratricopeptide repeat protein 14 [Elysia marginata]|uniref:Tetratricopeptide repeat protein 14 n=1 Tax=Elysia marginata TaxID=1093978 RepID=A0AAV4J6Z9_9GAST|nr:tetratricopeptide repeat protein 14 [Elysia marginata]
MDVKLVGAAVQFHGEELLDSLTDEQGEPPSSNVAAYLQRRRQFEPEIKDKLFQRNLCGFIARKSDLLFRPLTEDEKNHNRRLEAIDDSFAIMPPLETFMDIPSYSRREEFWKSLRVNDCVTGVVTSIIDQGLRLALLCIDKGVSRDIDDLNIPAFCPVKELPKLYAKESALDAFQKRDIVRGIVLSVVEETERIIISLKAESVPDEKTYPRIGLITEDDFPVHYSVVQGVEMFKKGDYIEAMQHLNRALQVDAENVEALVARGALYANKENFPSAIRDFEEALSYNPKHSNARNYLIETLLTVGRMCEERRDLEKAAEHYESVLKLDENHSEATELLRGCRQLMSKRARKDSESTKHRGKSRPDSPVEKEVPQSTRKPHKSGLDSPVNAEESGYIKGSEVKGQMHGMAKGIPRYGLETSAQEDHAEEVPYHRSAASSFLPVSSYDFFSKYQSRSPSSRRHGFNSPSHSSKSPFVRKSSRSPESQKVWKSGLEDPERGMSEGGKHYQESEPFRVVSSFGKFGPLKKQVDTGEKAEKFDLDVKRSTYHLSDRHREDMLVGGTARLVEKGRNIKGEKSTGKGDPFSFMPRILRKPKMDDPEVNKPLMSSNQMEWDKKSKKEADSKSSSKSKSDEASRGTREVNIADGKHRNEQENSSAESKKPRKNRWDEEGKTREQVGQADSKTVNIIAKLSNLEQSAGVKTKKELEEEMEKEIERRVQERLRQQQESPAHKETGSKNSRSPEDQSQPAKEKRRKGRKDDSEDDDERQDRQKDKRTRERKRSEDSDSDDSKRRYSTKKSERKRSKKKDGSSDDEPRNYRRGGFKGKPVWLEREKTLDVQEKKKGWCKDSFGNKYYADRGKMLFAGKNYDRFGNVFYTQRDSSTRARFKMSKSRGRGRSRSSSSSGSSEGSSPYRRRKGSSDDGKSKTRADKAEDEQESKENAKSQTLTSELLKKEDNRQGDAVAGLADQSPRITTTGLSDKTGEKNEEKGDPDKPGISTSSDVAGPSDIEKLTRSRWDTENNKSRWEETGSEKGSGALKGKRDSLTDLEKFLLELKQKKKKQWIAEGKIKET